MWAEDFSFRLDVLYGGAGINTCKSNLHFLIKNINKKYVSSIFFANLCHENLDPDSLEMLEPDPYLDSMNPDPKLGGKLSKKFAAELTGHYEFYNDLF